MGFGRQMLEESWNWVKGFTTDDVRWFVTFVVALGGLAVAYFSLRVSSNSVAISEDMKEIAERADRHSVRPYIIIPDDAWSFEVVEFDNGNQQARLKFSKVQNAGLGPAIRMFARLRVSYVGHASKHFADEGIEPFAAGSFETGVASYVPEKETVSIAFDSHFTWPPPEPNAVNGGVVFLYLDVYTFDVEERRYKTTYNLAAVHRAWNCLGTQLTGPVARRENNRLIVEGLSHDPEALSKETAGICFSRVVHVKSPEGPMTEEPAVTMKLPEDQKSDSE